MKRTKVGAEVSADEISSNAEISELPMAGNAELLHPRMKRRPFHSKSSGRASRAADDPIGLFEGAQDVFSLGVFERRNGGRRGRPGRFQLREREFQFGAGRREDDGAFNDVLKLADVAGPVIPL